jgi:hypothetical protein
MKSQLYFVPKKSFIETIEMEETMKDPIGPGTPAWNSFDNAVEAYRRARSHNRRIDDDYRRTAIVGNT